MWGTLSGQQKNIREATWDGSVVPKATHPGCWTSCNRAGTRSGARRMSDLLFLARKLGEGARVRWALSSLMDVKLVCHVRAANCEALKPVARARRKREDISFSSYPCSWVMVSTEASTLCSDHLGVVLGPGVVLALMPLISRLRALSSSWMPAPNHSGSARAAMWAVMVAGALLPVLDSQVRKDSTVSCERGFWAEERKILNIFQQDSYCLLEVGRSASSITATESSKNFLRNSFRRKSMREDSATSVVVRKGSLVNTQNMSRVSGHHTTLNSGADKVGLTPPFASAGFLLPSLTSNTLRLTWR
ncbi:hypothetical protein Pmani_004776 [Petrolisthes manimaculis]|uniref:Uncharacterized protein n=1 Tax=Petrolisthes manimaculis TaxID=1843537 RepID=A0AAE1QE42_9EUCA|nr:hypothetical protein Pmani_004776 [Petrolisthes manimaculis]